MRELDPWKDLTFPNPDDDYARRRNDDTAALPYRPSTTRPNTRTPRP